VGGVLRSGEAVQVDPINPTLKAPGTKRLKLEMMHCFQLLLSKFNLRLYNPVMDAVRRCRLTLSNPR